MRIGITCYPTHGGSGVVATELGKHLAARGHSVAFISYSAPLRLIDLPPRVCFHEVQVEGYPLLKQFPYTLALASKIAEVAASHELEILHVHYAIPFTCAAILAKQMVPERNLRIVTTLHGTDITIVGANSSFYPVTTFSLEQSDAVSAVSQFLRDETIRTFGVKRDIDVINNFVDPDHYAVTGNDDRSRNSQAGGATIVHISNFRSVKRVSDVIRVFARVSNVMDTKLVLVGDGPDLGMATMVARELGVFDRVRFVGVVDDVAPYLSQADLFLLPSETEGFGFAALEAMASGVPVVATNVGGVPEVIEHGVTGYLASVGDIDAMAEYAIDLLRDRAKYRRFSAAAREHAVMRFGHEYWVTQYELLYRRLLPVAAPQEITMVSHEPT